jgi:hypothetical protein
MERMSLLMAARCANGGGEIRIGHAGWRKKADGLQMRLLGVNGNSHTVAIYLIDRVIPPL